MVMTPPRTETYLVRTPSGATMEVLTDSEVDYYQDRATRYLHDNALTNVSDLADLDRILAMELMVWRWQSWSLKGMDWWGGDINERELQANITKYLTELRHHKSLLGIDKATRDREKGDDIATYIENLRLRAKQFEVMRNEQFTKVITLFHELCAQITLLHNTTKDEQKELSCSRDDVFEWIETIAIPEFKKIDATFREEKQRFWVRQQ